MDVDTTGGAQDVILTWLPVQWRSLFQGLWDMMDVLLTLVLQTTGTSFAFFGSGGFGGCVGAVGTVPVNLLFLIPLGFLGLGPPPP